MALVATLIGSACSLPAGPAAETDSAEPILQPARQTDTLPNDPDDPAIWLHPTDPAKSLIITTDKIAQRGGLFVFGLDGKLRQTIAPLDRPNNVDVEYGFAVGDRRIDIAVVTERKQHRLRVFAIAPDGSGLSDIAPAGIPVLKGHTGEASEPMGIALYKRPRDGAVYAIVAPKTGGTKHYLSQYRLEDDGRGSVKGTLARRFGAFSMRGSEPGAIGEIEAVAVDDELSYVYFSDERFAIRKWHADPDHADAARELAAFGADGYEGDREGLAIYATSAGNGYVVSGDQVEGATRLRLYRREGTAANPHDHREVVATIRTASDATDGLDVTSRSLPGFPRGLLVMMNSGPKNFLIYRWEDVEAVQKAQVTRALARRRGQS